MLAALKKQPGPKGRGHAAGRRALKAKKFWLGGNRLFPVVEILKGRNSGTPALPKKPLVIRVVGR